jgi:hypothetical protein
MGSKLITHLNLMKSVCTYIHTHISSATGLHAVHRHCSTVYNFATVHAYVYSINRVVILFHEHLFHFPPCLGDPRRSRQHKRRQAADNDVCEIARNLEIWLNNATLPGEWKKAIVVPVYKGDDRSAVTICRPISLTTAVGNQLEQL